MSNDYSLRFEGSPLWVVGPYEYTVVNSDGNDVGSVTASDRGGAGEKIANGDWTPDNSSK